jgi:hypothetical protein
MTDQARTEEEVVTGLLAVTLGGRKKPVRVLTMRESRVWKLELVEVLGKGIGSMDLSSASDVGPVMTAAIEKITDLVVAYDVDGTLGGRDWLETNATDQEVYAAFRLMLERSFPFVKDLRTALTEIRALGLAGALEGAKPAPAPADDPSEPVVGVSASTPT